jgi:hypothetical protein
MACAVHGKDLYHNSHAGDAGNVQAGQQAAGGQDG